MSDRPSLILVTSNGTGMGHLARQLAVAMAAVPRSRVTLFSFSVALPAATTDEIPGEYCPGPDRGWIPEVDWPHYVAGRLEALAREVTADVIVFDGVAPYRGITLAKRRLPETAFVWFRRGMWQPGVNDGQLWKSALFDDIIEPGDLAFEADRGPTATRGDARRVSPVSLVDVMKPLDRTEAARQLGIDPDRTNLLLGLGTGRLGDVSSSGRTILDAVLEQTDWQVSVITSAVAQSTIPHEAGDRVVELKGVFPLARYLKVFDAAVSAAGYNAVHEYLSSGIPTLLVPNRITRTDDQVARAESLANAGLALTVPDETRASLQHAVGELVEHAVRERIRETLAALPDGAKLGGARQTAAALQHLAETYVPAPLTPQQRLLKLRDDAKESLKRALGPNGTNRVRRALGHPPLDTAGRLRVAIDTEPVDPQVSRLRRDSDPSIETLLGEDIIEHLVPNASDSYRSARDLLIDRHYEVVSRN